MHEGDRNWHALTRRTVLKGVATNFALVGLAQPALAAGGLDAFVIGQMAAARIPGLALAIAQNGRTTFAQGYGFADLKKRRRVTPQTMFHIASITKTVTASAVMVLVEQGRIGLDDPVASHLDFSIAGKDAQAITFRHLLTHTSGISDAVYYQIDFRERGADANAALGDFLRDYLASGGRYVGSGNVTGTPGTAWDYSNVGYGLLGYLAGRILEQDMRRFTRDRFFTPLGLHNIAWTLAETPAKQRATAYDLVDGAVVPVPPMGFPDWPAGMIRASAADLACLVAAAANGGVSQGVRLLSEASMATMLEMHTPPGLPAWLTGQGLGWQQSLLDGVPRDNHWGGDPGVFTVAYLDPARHIAVVILSNLSVTPESRVALKAIAARALSMSSKDT